MAHYKISGRRRRFRVMQQVLEPLEPRRLFNTYTVTNNNDAGPGTLRQAILDGNAHPGLDTIAFNYLNGGAYAITPHSPLNAITDPVVIDATTQNGYAGKPLVRLDGASTGTNYASGLFIAANGCTIKGLAITGWHDNGIRVEANNTTISNNYIGLSTDGQSTFGSTYAGILLYFSGSNIISNNVIAASGLATFDAGISASHSVGNIFTGNFIGTNPGGTAALGNGGAGISLYNGSSNNRIGTNSDGVNDGAERNVISGNLGQGVAIFDATSVNNVIAGNYIGVDASGAKALGNQSDGIGLYGGGGNRVGIDITSANVVAGRNILSGNTYAGVTLQSSNSIVEGNYIGLASNGATTLPNGTGVGIYGGANNRIGINPADANASLERNLISSNSGAGVSLSGQGTTGNIINGNYIGLDVTGKLPRGNLAQGVALFTGAGGNRISQNVISASGGNNHYAGLELSGTGISGNAIQGNFIGTDASGTASLGNSGSGVLIDGGASGNLVGSNFDGIGDAAERNIISASGYAGVELDGAGTSGNTVAGNYIGTDITGKVGLGNLNQGVGVFFNASANSIDRNIIAANGTSNHYPGVELYASATANVVTGNLIGLDATGTNALGNGGVGVYIHYGASNNRIGTNGDGVNDALEGNTIANSGYGGVEIDDGATLGNQISGNKIGTDATGTRAMPNAGPGVFVRFGSSNNQIGGPSAVFGNLIANNGTNYTDIGGYHYNDAPGVVITETGTGNSIRANAIYSNRGLGIDLSASPAGSYFYFDGVNIDHASNLAEGPNHLQNYPVLLAATAGSATAISGRLTAVANTTLIVDFYASATPNPALFGDGERYLGSANVTTDAAGNAIFNVALPAATAAGEHLTATATDPDGNTSEFSADLKVNAPPTTLSATTWTPLGPAPISTLGDGVITAGRVADAVPDPSNANVMYLAADGGGVWKTTDWLDTNPIWTPLTDSQSSMQQDVGYKTLAIAQSNPQILYDAVSGPGSGILKSTNGGATWTLLASAQFDQSFFSSIIVSPSDPNTVYVGVWHSGTSGVFGVAGGVYKSTNGGTSWTNMTASVHTGDASDVVFDPNNPQTLYAGLVKDIYSANGATTAGLYKSTNAGATWTRFTGGLIPPGNVGSAIRIATAPTNSQTLYATFYDTALGNAPSGLVHRFGTANGGTTWTTLADLPTSNDDRYWHTVLAVSPSNSQVVYANADHELYQSTDGGGSWMPNAVFAEDPVNVRFDQGNALILTGDRGIYRWPGGATPFENKQWNLQNTENYTITLDPHDEQKLYAIAQDQGNVQVYSGAGVWNVATSGNEVGKVLVSPSNSARLFDFAAGGANGDAGPASGVVIRSDDGGATWTSTDAGLPTAVVNFPQSYIFQKSFAMDPANPHRLILGLNQVYETTDDADSWHSLTGASPAWGAQYVSYVAIAPSSPNTIYVATADGKLWLTTNDGGSWSERDVGLPIDSFNSVVDMKVNPANAAQVVAVTSADRAGRAGKHVWLTNNSGAAWSNISGTLNPENWVQSIAVDWRLANPTLYLGSARGVYSTTLNGTNTAWAPFASGMPNVPVTDLELLPGSNLLAAATYGRGVFEIRVGVPTAIAMTLGNSVTIKRDADNIHADITANGAMNQVAIAQASTFSITGGAGDDTLTLDFSNGNPLPTGGVSFDGGAGVNSVNIIGTSGSDTLTAAPIGLTFAGPFGAVPIHAVNLQAIQFHGGSGGNDAINLVNGTYTLDADTPTGTPNVSVAVAAAATANFALDQHLANLTIADGTANLSATRHTMNLHTLSITGAGLLDIANCFLYIDNTYSNLAAGGTQGSANGTPYAVIQQYVNKAYNLSGSANPGTLGDYTGRGGIGSAVAKASYAGGAIGNVSLVSYDGAQQDGLNPLGIGGLTLGPTSNSGNGTGIPFGKTLIRPTLIGDMNGDGVVDDFDITLFSAYGLYKGDGTGNATALGPQVGDFNHNGKVDDTDILIFSAAGNYLSGSYPASSALAVSTLKHAQAIAISPTAVSGPVVVGRPAVGGASRRSTPRHPQRRRHLKLARAMPFFFGP